MTKLRRQKHMSIADLAEAAGLSAPVVQRFEAGLREPRPREAKAIAQVLGIDWTRFYDDEEERG